MDIFDEATENEERDRAAAIANARNLERHPLTEKRRAFARAKAKAGDALGIFCENCNDDLSADAADIFCCKECFEDWEKRERALRLLSRNF